MDQQRFEHTVVIKKVEVPHAWGWEVAMQLIRDKWFLSQMIALLVSFLGLAALFLGLDAFSATTPTAGPAQQVLRAEIVEKSLADYLQRQVDTKSDLEILFQRHSQIPLSDLPAGALRWDWSGPPLFSNGPRSVYVLTLSNDKGWSLQIPLNISVRIKAKIFIAKNPIQPRSMIRDEDFEVQATEVIPTILGDLIVQKIPDKQRSKGFIPRGATLSKRQIEELPVIQTGSLVDMIYKEGALSIRIPVRSRQDGRVGQVVQVQADDTKKTFQAIVVDPMTVELVRR